MVVNLRWVLFFKFCKSIFAWPSIESHGFAEIQDYSFTWGPQGCVIKLVSICLGFFSWVHRWNTMFLHFHLFYFAIYRWHEE
jgi:hypothetical protein